MSSDIKLLFEPRALALIGASHDAGKVGYKILENILKGGFKGKVFPVNPKGGKILGLKVFKSVLEIKSEVDLAIIAIPAKAVFEAVEQCAKKKIKFLVIISSGFSEAGNIEEENRIVDFAKKQGMRVLGPNIFGIYSAKVSLNATFGGKVAKKGNVAIISQSGALGIALMGKTETEGMGLSSIVFEGNKSDLSEKDFLPYFAEDSKTKAIFIYLEGVEDGRELFSVLEKVTKKKPVIIIKAGVSERGAAAAISHTGSLAGEEKVFSAAMKQVGVLRAAGLQQAIHWAKFLSDAPLPEGQETVIITNGGGMGILATDICEKYGIKLSDDHEEIQRSFASLVPAFGSLKNPIDLTGQARAEDYRRALLTACQNPAFGSIICLGCETAVLDNVELRRVFTEIYQKAGKPVVFAFVGGREVQEKLISLKEKGVPIFEVIEEAVSCLAALYIHQKNLKLKRGRCEAVTPRRCKAAVLSKAVVSGIQKIGQKSQLVGRGTVSLSDSQKMARLLEIDLPKSLLVKTLPQALDFSRRVGFPLVAKIVSPQIIHKTDFGGVILDLKNKSELKNAFKFLLQKIKRDCPECVVEGVEISQMVEGGVEMVVGAKKDRDFGTVVMVGLGGIFVETLKDIVFRVYPLSFDEAREMVEELRSYPLLEGVRNGKRKEIEAVVETILKLGNIVESCPEISEIEINPLKVFEEGRGVKALDIRILMGG